MEIKKHITLLLGMLVLLSACVKESLEDTYKKYSGDREIRYIGKCTDILVQPGWKRIIVSWKNNVDPTIKKVKVTWKLDETKDSVLLERGTTEFNIRTLNGNPLEDGNYEISIQGVDANNKTSIADPVFARPYTATHEDIMAFNRLISKTYFVKNRLILYFLEWQNSIKKAVLNYTKEDGSAGKLELTKDLIKQKYYLLEDKIDPTKPLILERTGELQDCSDIIEFDPYEFYSDKIYEADFRQEMKRQYGYSEELPENWVNNVETLYLDWSINSFNDLLNFPNLKKLVLGSRRYLLDEAVDDSQYGQSKVSEIEASNFVLQKLHELNGLTVERYNKHFNQIRPAEFIEDKGNTNTIPNVEFIDLSQLTFTVYPKDPENFSSGLERLTDNDHTTNWDPRYSNEFITYELTLDLQKQKNLNGLCFVQKQYTRVGEIAIAPEYIKIKVSNDRIHWEDATYVEENMLGKSNGEINFIPFSENVKNSTFKYIQVQINAGFYANTYYSGAAEISLY